MITMATISTPTGRSQRSEVVLAPTGPPYDRPRGAASAPGWRAGLDPWVETPRPGGRAAGSTVAPKTRGPWPPSLRSPMHTVERSRDASPDRDPRASPGRAGAPWRRRGRPRPVAALARGRGRRGRPPAQGPARCRPGRPAVSAVAAEHLTRRYGGL